MFKIAIVRKPGKSMLKGLTTAELGLPDYEKALVQHAEYVKVLKECGLEVTVLEGDEKYPDSTFVEDVALLTSECAIITNPGALSRRGEIIEIKNVLKEHYNNIEEIKEPGTVEAGDIMMVGSNFYIGLSERTNEKGAEQVIEYLEKYGMKGSTVSLEEVLHLKTGLALPFWALRGTRSTREKVVERVVVLKPPGPLSGCCLNQMQSLVLFNAM